MFFVYSLVSIIEKPLFSASFTAEAKRKLQTLTEIPTTPINVDLNTLHIALK